MPSAGERSPAARLRMRGRGAVLKQSSLGGTAHWAVPFAAELRADPCPASGAFRRSEPRGILIRSDSPRFGEQPTGLFSSLRNSLGQNTPRLLYALP